MKKIALFFGSSVAVAAALVACFGDDELYDRPATLFVNQFVGSSNILRGEVLGSDAAGCLVRLADGAAIHAADSKNMQPGAKVVVALRPEALVLSDAPAQGARPGRIKAVLPLGPQVAYDIATADGSALKAIVTRAAETKLRAIDTPVHVAPLSPAACNLFPAE